MLRVLVTGDRNWNSYTEIYAVLDRLHENFGIDAIIEGECVTGADSCARYWATNNKVLLEKFPAHWDVHKKAAGPIRNQQMIEEGDPDIVVAFHKDLQNSKGTKDCVKRAIKYGIPVFLNDLTTMVTKVNGPVLEEADRLEEIIDELRGLKFTSTFVGDGTSGFTFPITSGETFTIPAGVTTVTLGSWPPEPVIASGAYVTVETGKDTVESGSITVSGDSWIVPWYGKTDEPKK